MDAGDADLIASVLRGNPEHFEGLVKRYQPKVFATARRYARNETEAEDVVQEVFIKAFEKLGTFRGEAPFEHWLMRLAVRTCYDLLRNRQRSRETTFSDITEAESSWLERFAADPEGTDHEASAAKLLVTRLLEQLSPPARLVIQLLEIEERSVKEISQLTGWSVPLVKVRAFRARAQMKKCLRRMVREQYL